MPNQDNPATPNSPAATTASPAVNSAPPIVTTDTDLPPLPPDFQNIPVSPPSSSPPVPPTEPPGQTGTGTPNDTSNIVTSSPKKKFGGGRIIATILGILLLVGGVGAGILLTQQPQLFQQKAYINNPNPRTDLCRLISVTAEDACPKLVNNTGTNNISTYTTHFKITNLTASEHTLSLTKHSNWCRDPYGQFQEATNTIACKSNPVNDDIQVTLAPNETDKDVVIERPSDTGTACGSYQTDLQVHSIDGNTKCQGEFNFDTIKAGVCLTGINCNNASPSPSPTASPTVPQCLNVRAYSSTWTLLTDAQLSTLAPDAIINFCVAGSSSSGTFDQAEFQINSAAKTVVTTPSARPSSTNEFCQSYTIKASDLTINVKARIHHTALGWFGESI